MIAGAAAGDLAKRIMAQRRGAIVTGALKEFQALPQGVFGVAFSLHGQISQVVKHPGDIPIRTQLAEQCQAFCEAEASGGIIL